jgi:hypothetical protein
VRPCEPKKRNGIPLLVVRKGGKPVTLELVNRLRDALDAHPRSRSSGLG